MIAAKPGGLVGGRAGAAVLADRQADVLARRPDRVERRVEEEVPAGVERRHHDPAEPVLLGPVDVLTAWSTSSNDTSAWPARRPGASAQKSASQRL